jgi:hypothetical protein
MFQENSFLEKIWQYTYRYLIYWQHHIRTNIFSKQVCSHTSASEDSATSMTMHIWSGMTPWTETIFSCFENLNRRKVFTQYLGITFSSEYNFFLSVWILYTTDCRHNCSILINNCYFFTVTNNIFSWAPMALSCQIVDHGPP